MSSASPLQRPTTVDSRDTPVSSTMERKEALSQMLSTGLSNIAVVPSWSDCVVYPSLGTLLALVTVKVYKLQILTGRGVRMPWTMLGLLFIWAILAFCVAFCCADCIFVLLSPLPRWLSLYDSRRLDVTWICSALIVVVGSLEFEGLAAILLHRWARCSLLIDIAVMWCGTSVPFVLWIAQECLTEGPLPMKIY